MQLLQILYVSQAATPMDADALQDLLGQCYRNNRERGLTGLLIYSAGHFIQLLEGEPVAVQTMYQRIEADPRHTNVELLMRELVDQRLFDRWRMGLLDMEQCRPLDRERLDAVCRSLRSGEADAKATAAALLREFRDQLPAPQGMAAA
jgi:hypothetical protein